MSDDNEGHPITIEDCLPCLKFGECSKIDTLALTAFLDDNTERLNNIVIDPTVTDKYPLYSLIVGYSEVTLEEALDRIGLGEILSPGLSDHIGFALIVHVLIKKWMFLVLLGQEEFPGPEWRVRWFKRALEKQAEIVARDNKLRMAQAAARAQSQNLN